MKHDIVIAGVGGQGILTIARVLSMAAIKRGLHVKQAEVHGMSQRGGAVYSHLRISDQEIFSDLIPPGGADMILAVEPMEALRYIDMLRPGGAIVASTNAEVNIPDYPQIERVLARIAVEDRHVAIDMEKLARAAGGVLAANVVALGAASLYLGFSLTELQEAVEALFERKGERVVGTNVRALRFGRTAAHAYREALERGVVAQDARGWIATLSAELLASEDDLDFTGLHADVDASKLTGAEAHAFESLLLGAYGEGRSQLFEHEVYRLIELVGAISPPRHTFVPKGTTISDDTLTLYPGNRVVVKLVSPDVVHKSDAGAVRIVANELETVRTAIDAMIAKHAPTASVAGVLVVEFVEHDSSGLGSELFVGIRATREFGPVIAAGLGGVHTEYLASKMLPGVAVAKAVANDVDAESFLEQFKQTVAYDALSGAIRGHERVVTDAELLQCFRAFISIARQFCVDRGEEGPDVAELEVNPFAFSGQRMIPLDGRGRLGAAWKARAPRPIAHLRAMLEPETIVLVGVSAKAGSFGRVILGNILESGFPADKVRIVKPDTDQIDGVKCIPNLESHSGPVDLLVVAAPAAATPDILRSANAHGAVRSAIVISGGAGETEGTDSIAAEFALAIAEGRASEHGGTVVLGPNCMGVRSLPGQLDTFFVPEAKLPARRDLQPQPIALISQSGAFLVSRLSRHSDLQPRFAISIGNQIDLTISDFLRAMESREDIHAVGVYLEGFADLDGAEAAASIERLTESGRPVVFYKAGRTESGRSAAAGHTAAVAGDYDICQSTLVKAGAIVVNDFSAFSQALELAIGLNGRTLGAGRTFAVTNAGMEAVAMADVGLRLATIDDSTHAAIEEALKHGRLDALVGVRNPLDLTPAADERVFDSAVRAALGSEEVDAVIVSCVPLAPTLHTLATEVDDPASFVQLAQIWRRESNKLIVFALDGGAEYDLLTTKLKELGFPVFRSADEAARTLARFAARVQTPGAVPAPPELAHA